jgi:hypothetical protein
MQIHELTQPRKRKLDEAGFFNTVSDAIKTGGATLGSSDQAKQARRSADQERLNQRATKALGKLEKMLPPPEPVPTLDQAISKLKSNPSAQQWINGVVAKWPAEAQRLAQSTRTIQDIKEGPLSDRARQRSLTNKTTTTPATPATPNPFASTVNNLSTPTNTGLKPDPTTKTSTGGTATTTSAGQIHVASPANMNMYLDQFRNWINSQLKTIDLDTLESDPKVKSILEPLLQKIVAAKDNPQAQQKLVHDFFSYAVAANHVVQAKKSQNQNRGQGNTTPGQPLDATQQAAVTGLSVADLYLLNKQAHAAGEPAPTTSTGNKWMDSLVQRIWKGQ